MKIKLNKTDIERIIADKFGVQPVQVTLTTEETMEGYGVDEHIVHTPVVYVDGLNPSDISRSPRMGTPYNGIAEGPNCLNSCKTYVGCGGPVGHYTADTATTEV